MIEQNNKPHDIDPNDIWTDSEARRNMGDLRGEWFSLVSANIPDVPANPDAATTTKLLAEVDEELRDLNKALKDARAKGLSNVPTTKIGFTFMAKYNEQKRRLEEVRTQLAPTPEDLMISKLVAQLEKKISAKYDSQIATLQATIDRLERALAGNAAAAPNTEPVVPVKPTRPFPPRSAPSRPDASAATVNPADTDEEDLVDDKDDPDFLKGKKSFSDLLEEYDEFNTEDDEFADDEDKPITSSDLSEEEAAWDDDQIVERTQKAQGAEKSKSKETSPQDETVKQRILKDFPFLKRLGFGEVGPKTAEKSRKNVKRENVKPTQENKPDTQKPITEKNAPTDNEPWSDEELKIQTDLMVAIRDLYDVEPAEIKPTHTVKTRDGLNMISRVGVLLSNDPEIVTVDRCLEINKDMIFNMTGSRDTFLKTKLTEFLREVKDIRAKSKLKSKTK